MTGGHARRQRSGGAARAVTGGELFPAADHHRIGGPGHGAVVRASAANLLRQASAT